MKDYAVILKFDDVSSKKIEDLTKKINDIVGMNYTIPPHITLGVFRTDNIEAYDEIFKKFSEELKRTEVIFFIHWTVFSKSLIYNTINYRRLT